MPNGSFEQRVWWPTTILVAQRSPGDDFNDRLAARIRHKEREILANEIPQAIAGVQSGLTAYWLKFNVLNWDHPECAELTALVLRGVRQFIATVADPHDPDYAIAGISCWANVLRHGESLDIHHHDPGFVSGHYIVKSGMADEAVPSESGNTVYYRPGFIERSQGDVFGSPWDAEWRVSAPPVEGALTLFPSYVRHEVRPHMGSSERISVALDVYVKKQQVPFRFAAPRWYVPRAQPVTA